MAMAQAMTLALWLPRADHLRALGPIASAARRRGWRVSALCPIGGPKDDAIRQRDAIGRLGITAAPIYDTGDALERLHQMDAVVAVGLTLPDWVVQRVMPITRAHGTAWVSVGYLQEELLQVLTGGPARLNDWDIVTTSTWQGVDWLAETVARTRSAAVAGEVRRRFVAVGMPSLDPLVRLDRAACRATHGLPKDGRVLLFVPAAHPHLMPRWRRWVFDGSLSWLAPAMALPTYAQVIHAVAEYAERHEATVVVKTRAKNPDPPQLGSLGRIVGDLSWYPHTTLELVTAADASCGLVSGMALEAAVAGLPQVHFFAWPPAASEHPLFLPFRERFWLGSGPWGAGGDDGMVSLPLHLYRDLSRLDLWARGGPWLPRPSPEACRAAVRAIAGEVDGKASDRVLDAIEAGR